MLSIIDLYKKNLKKKFFIDLIIVFFTGQLIIGFFLFNFFHLTKQFYVNHDILYKFIIYSKNIFILSFFIFSNYLLLHDAKLISNQLFKLIKTSSLIYFLISFFITILSNKVIYTPIAYIGNMIFNFINGNIHDSLFQNLSTIIFGNTF